MNIDPDNPLLDPKWVRDIGNAIYTYVLDVDKRTEATVARHRELTDAQREANKIHREGWRLTSDAILRGFGLVADAIRQHGR